MYMGATFGMCYLTRRTSSEVVIDGSMVEKTNVSEGLRPNMQQHYLRFTRTCRIDTNCCTEASVVQHDKLAFARLPDAMISLVTFKLIRGAGPVGLPLFASRTFQISKVTLSRNAYHYNHNHTGVPNKCSRG